jgi:hypothetical protein
MMILEEQLADPEMKIWEVEVELKTPARQTVLAKTQEEAIRIACSLQEGWEALEGETPEISAEDVYHVEEIPRDVFHP